MLRGVALFEFFDLFLGFFFRVIHGLADLLPALGGLFGSGLLVRVLDLLGCVLGIFPGFLHRAFGLVDYAFVGQLFAADSLSDALLHLADSLIDLAAHLIFIHKFLLILCRTNFVSKFSIAAGFLVDAITPKSYAPGSSRPSGEQRRRPEFPP